MPDYGHHHSQSTSGLYESKITPSQPPQLLQLGQILGSNGPTTRRASSGNTAANSSYAISPNGPGTIGAAVTSSHPRNPSTSSIMSSQHNFNPPPAFDPTRRGQSFSRQPEELHMPSKYVPMVQQQASTYIQEPTRGGHVSSSGLPGALQPGSSIRPAGPATTSTTIPTLPPISTQTQQYPSPSRGSTSNNSHSYSRSSPGTGYGHTPDGSGFSSPPSYRYTAAQTPQTTSYSPLGLADIRPRADSNISEGQLNSQFQDYGLDQPTNCNYMAPWPAYAYDWCKWPVQHQGLGDAAGKMAVGSYIEDGHNFIQILETQIVPDSVTDSTPGTPRYGIEFTKAAEATSSYPVTRILWEPESSQKKTCDLLATSGDHLRLWSLPSQEHHNSSNSITRPTNTGESTVQKLTPLALLSNSKSPEHTAPLTSLDWNTLSPSLIITSSIDTTCTIWDIPSLTAKTQLIAHDKEVFDVRFCANSTDVFVSCGADGSVRMFDLRSLEHSTIIYEPPEKNDKAASPGDVSPTKAQQTMSHAPPLLRIAASPHDTHLLATFCQDSNVIRILDVRQPGQALLELQGHAASVNCMEWSPSRRGTLASGADDSLVLVWDLLNQNNSASAVSSNVGPPVAENARSPAASWQCDYEVGNLSWAPQSGLTSQGGDWLGVCGGRGIWGVNL